MPSLLHSGVWMEPQLTHSRLSDRSSNSSGGQEERGEAVGQGRAGAEPRGAPRSAAPAPPRRETGPGRASDRHFQPSEKQFPGSDRGHAVIFYKILFFVF